MACHWNCTNYEGTQPLTLAASDRCADFVAVISVSPCQTTGGMRRYETSVPHSTRGHNPPHCEAQRQDEPTLPKQKRLLAEARSLFCVFTVSRQPLFVRMTVCGFAVLVSMFAMVMSRSSVLLSFFMVAMIVFMGGLQVVVSRSLMMSSGSVMMLTGAMLLLFRHLKSPSSKRPVRLRSKMPASGTYKLLSPFSVRQRLFF
jgi:hypothetical protein